MSWQCIVNVFITTRILNKHLATCKGMYVFRSVSIGFQTPSYDLDGEYALLLILIIIFRIGQLKNVFHTTPFLIVVIPT